MLHLQYLQGKKKENISTAQYGEWQQQIRETIHAFVDLECSNQKLTPKDVAPNGILHRKGNQNKARLQCKKEGWCKTHQSGWAFTPWFLCSSSIALDWQFDMLNEHEKKSRNKKFYTHQCIKKKKDGGVSQKLFAPPPSANSRKQARPRLQVAAAQ